MAGPAPVKVASTPTEEAPTMRPRSPATRSIASACVRASGATRDAARAVGEEPRSVPPAAQAASAAQACGRSPANGKAAMEPAMSARAGATTRSGPHLSASDAAGAAPSTDTADCSAKAEPICTGVSPNCSPASIRGSRVMQAPAWAAQEALCTSSTPRSPGSRASMAHCASRWPTVEGTAAPASSRLGMVSVVQRRVHAALATKTPLIRKSVGARPTAPMRAPPTAGPTSLPAEKPVMMVVIMRTRFSGVLMSATDVVAPASRLEAPRPEQKRAAMRGSRKPATPTPAVPTACTSSPETMARRRPRWSTSTAVGTLASSLERPKAETVKPNCAWLRPSS
mmetsp:Transcript_48753/g.155880  ORF Transcript_48753/g.155880 Transcript_48753/m.155880 type:complete len:340 (-) Transcript_48753:930-1949(-)